MQTRRRFLRKMAALTAGASVSAGCKTNLPQRTSERPPGASTSDKGRKRRVIFNSDGDELIQAAYGGYSDPFETIPARYNSPQEFLALRTTPLKGTQVDSLFYCGYTNEPSWELPKTGLEALGPNPVKHVVDFAHQNGMEFVYSLRMNDIHSAFSPGANFWSRFKVQNPHLLQINTGREEFERRFVPWIEKKVKEHPLAEQRSQFGPDARQNYAWSAYDYARPEVRARMLEIVEGACQRHDLDAIELDWCRASFYFKFGQESRNIPIMNDFVRQVRQRTDRIASKRGRPILLAMRVMDSLERAWSVGLDVETWVRQGLVDILIGGAGYTPFSIPMTPWTQLGHQYGIPVYGCVNRSVGPYPPDQLLEYMRAVAGKYWHEGVDGIYVFNLFYFPKDDLCLHEIGDPKGITKKDKLYYFEQDYSYFASLNGTCWPGQLPRSLTSLSGPASTTLKLRVADQPETARRVLVQAQWKEESGPARASFQLNDQPLVNPRSLPPEKYPNFNEQSSGLGWTEFETRALRKGINTLQVTVQPPGEGDSAEPVTLQQVRVFVRYS